MLLLRRVTPVLRIWLVKRWAKPVTVRDFIPPTYSSSLFIGPRRFDWTTTNWSSGRHCLSTIKISQYRLSPTRSSNVAEHFRRCSIGAWSSSFTREIKLGEKTSEPFSCIAVLITIERENITLIESRRSFSSVENNHEDPSNSINDILDDKATITMTHFDVIFRRLILSQSFTHGWGNPAHLQELSASRRAKVAIRNNCLKLVPAESINENTVQIIKQETRGDRHYIDAKFQSPMAIHFPNVVRLMRAFRSIHLMLLSLDSAGIGHCSFSTGPTTWSSIWHRFYSHRYLLCGNRWSRLHPSTSAHCSSTTQRVSHWHYHSRESVLRLEKATAPATINTLLCQRSIRHGRRIDARNDGIAALVSENETRTGHFTWILPRWSHGFLGIYHVSDFLSIRLVDQYTRDF